MPYTDLTSNEFFIGRLDKNIKCAMNGRQLRRHMNRKNKKVALGETPLFRTMVKEYSSY